jgi:hypothetical protein
MLLKLKIGPIFIIINICSPPYNNDSNEVWHFCAASYFSRHFMIIFDSKTCEGGRVLLAPPEVEKIKT